MAASWEKTTGDRIAEAVIPTRRPADNKLELKSLPTGSLSMLPNKSSVVYGMAAMDDRGRIANHATIDALEWTSEDHLAMQVLHGAVVVQKCGEGSLMLARRGSVKIPAPVRHWCAINPGDQVLLVAVPEHGVLLLHPAATLNEMMLGYHTSLINGLTR